MVLRLLPQSMTGLSLVLAEFAKIWASASYHLSQQLALHQVGLTSFSPSHPDESRRSPDSPLPSSALVLPLLGKQEQRPSTTPQCTQCDGHLLCPCRCPRRSRPSVRKRAGLFLGLLESTRSELRVKAWKPGTHLGLFQVWEPPAFYPIEPEDVCQLFLTSLVLHGRSGRGEG